MAWNITSDAAQPSTYGSTTDFNSANSAPFGSGINWQEMFKTLGQGSEDKVSGALSPAAYPTVTAPSPQIPNSPTGRPSPLNLRELLTLLAQRQQLYQQAATGPAVKGGLPQEPPRPLGLLGI